MQDTDKLSQEIIALERAYWTAMVEKDLEAALRLTDFPCLVAGSHGTYVVDRAQYEQMFKEGQEAVRAFEFKEDKAHVRQLGPEVAVIAYEIASTFTKDGERKAIHAVDTSTWIKRDGQWVCAMHTETELAKKE